MSDEHEDLQRGRRRTVSTGCAVVISAVLGLLVALLSNVVANLISVPAGWEWVPVAALVVVFLASLPVTLSLARQSQKESEERGTKPSGVTIESVELNRSEIGYIRGDQVTVEDAKLTDSKISDIEAR